MLNVWDMISMFRIVAMFVKHLHKNKVSQIMCRYVYDVSPYKFHIPRSNVSLIIAIRPEAKEEVTMVAILLFYILQKHFFKKKAAFF